VLQNLDDLLQLIVDKGKRDEHFLHPLCLSRFFTLHADHIENSHIFFVVLND